MVILDNPVGMKRVDVAQAKAETVYVSTLVAWVIALKSGLGRAVAKAPVETVLGDYGSMELP